MAGQLRLGLAGLGHVDQGDDHPLEGAFAAGRNSPAHEHRPLLPVQGAQRRFEFQGGRPLRHRVQLFQERLGRLLFQHEQQAVPQLLLAVRAIERLGGAVQVPHAHQGGTDARFIGMLQTVRPQIVDAAGAQFRRVRAHGRVVHFDQGDRRVLEEPTMAGRAVPQRGPDTDLGKQFPMHDGVDEARADRDVDPSLPGLPPGQGAGIGEQGEQEPVGQQNPDSAEDGVENGEAQGCAGRAGFHGAGLPAGGLPQGRTAWRAQRRRSRQRLMRNPQAHGPWPLWAI